MEKTQPQEATEHEESDVNNLKESGLHSKQARKEAKEINRLFYEHIPKLGLKNYWHPVCKVSEVTEKPKPMTLMGERVLLVRRNGKVYSVFDECPHRGTRLSRGTCEFPGTNTITCIYHGWTFDVTDGKLAATLTDGPDSPILEKNIKVRTYPVEERCGIVWIWLAEEEPVAIEDDIPLGIQNATSVDVVQRHVKGNWRWHAENPGLGHATMLHRDSMYMRFVKMFGYAKGLSAPLTDEGEDGEWVQERCEGYDNTGHFPGLGEWPLHRIGEVIPLAEMPPVLGVTTIVSIRLPGIVRITNFPIRGSMYYEWFTQTDEDHYIYFQTCCSQEKSFLKQLWFKTRFHFWGRFTGMIRFNKQDLAMTEDSHEYAERNGYNDPAPLYRPDNFQMAWRRYLLKQCRGLDLPEMKDIVLETRTDDSLNKSTGGKSNK